MYRKIVDEYYTVILNYCMYRLNNSKTAAEDVTQEVFLALYRKLDKLKLSADIKYWLFRAADFEIKNYIRKNPSFVPIEDFDELAAEDTYPNIEDNCFDCLSGEEMALLNDYYSDESKENVAKSHKINMNTLYIRIHKIRKKLEIDLNKTHKLVK